MDPVHTMVKLLLVRKKLSDKEFQSCHRTLDPYENNKERRATIARSRGIEVKYSIIPENVFPQSPFLTFHEKKRPYIILKWAKAKTALWI